MSAEALLSPYGEPPELAAPTIARGASTLAVRSPGTRQGLAGAHRFRARPGFDKSRGRFLFIMGLLVFGSGVLALRIEVAGLFVHPQLLVVFPAFLWILSGGEWARVKAVVPPMILVAGAFGMSHLLGGGPYGQFVKLIASLLVLFVAAALTRSQEDLRLGTLGLALGVGLLAARGVLGLEEARLGVGLNPAEEVASKNYFSLLGLPAIFIAGAWLLHGRRKPIDVALLVPALAVIGVAISGSANRSGWISLAAVPLLLAKGRQSARMLLGLSGLVAVVALGVDRLGLTPVIEERVELTRSGYASDQLRENLYVSGVEVFAGSPLIGSGMPRINEELGKAMNLPSSEWVGPHSLLIYVLAGGGLLCAIPFGLLAWKVMHPQRRSRRHEEGRSGASDQGVAWLLPRLGLLWLLRGLFSDEILYSPAFNMSFGLFYGAAASIGVSSTPGSLRLASSLAGVGRVRVAISRHRWGAEPRTGVGAEGAEREFGA